MDEIPKQMLSCREIIDSAFVERQVEEPQSQDELLKRVRDTNTEGNFYAEVIMNIQSILYGEVDALEFFLQGELMSEFYRDAEGSYNYFKVFGAYLDALTHKNPGMRILEIGAGTGGLTRQILETLVLSHGQEPRVGRYAIYQFREISPSFFYKAKEKFYSLHDGMRFATLEIEEDPTQQGFHEGTYDLIIAGNVSLEYNLLPLSCLKCSRCFTQPNT